MEKMKTEKLQRILRHEQIYMASLPESDLQNRWIVGNHIKLLATELLKRWKENTF